jgi:hypothetical protein
VFDDSIFNPHRAVQRVGDLFEQRKAYRLAALLFLRKREGLPSPVDEQGNPLETRMDNFGSVTYHDADGKQVTRVLFAGAGRDGKPGAFAVGQRKGANISEAERHWMDSAAPFEILDVAEDGRSLATEIADLHRDSANYERAAQVSHGPAGEQAPDLVLDGTSDAEVEARLEAYLRATRGSGV